MESKFCLSSQTTISSQRFFDFIQTEWQGVIRSKGFLVASIPSLQDLGHKQVRWHDMVWLDIGGQPCQMNIGQKINTV
jgi:hypothetical protein